MPKSVRGATASGEEEDDPRPDHTRAFAMLCGEPWHLRPHEIAALTMRQMQTLYFCARDKDGRPKSTLPPLPAKKATAEDMFAILSHFRPASEVARLRAEHAAKYGTPT